MPSKHQTGAKSSGGYDSDPKKMLATKNDLTIAALIRGIRKPERAQAYIDAELELADEEDRDVRKGIIGACNRKKTALEDGDGDASDVDVDTGKDTDTDEDDDAASHDRHDGDDSDDADVPTVPDRDTLEEMVAAHEHNDTGIVAKADGTKAACFECESYIGKVPRDG